MIVYFTRHGESVNNVADRALEATPANGDSLSERGWEQARGLGERLRGEGIEAILASPYGRAQETAQAIGEVLGLPYETDEDLYEVRQSDAYRAASPNYQGTGHVSLDDRRAARPRRARRGVLQRHRRARQPRAGSASRRARRRAPAVRLALGLPALLRRRLALPRGLLARAPAGAVPDVAHQHRHHALRAPPRLPHRGRSTSAAGRC